jgi:hypothetical protein
MKVVSDAFKENFPVSRTLPPDQPSALYGFFLEEEVLGGHVI